MIKNYLEKQKNKKDHMQKVRDLTQQLWQEEEKRLEMMKRKEKADQEVQNHKKLIDKLKDEIVVYKSSAIEDRRKLKVLESQNK